MSKKDKDKKRKEIKLGGEEKSVWDGDKIQQAVRFIRQNYNIRKPIQDTSKVTISHIDENKYAYPPTLNDLYIDLQIEGINISETLLHKIIESNNHIPPYDPIVEYFDSIRNQYKGESHIDLLCKHIVARRWDDKDEEYYQERCTALIRKWMVACVACWIGGTPNEIAIGLISDEGGLGKTFLSKYLLPKVLDRFFIVASRDDAKFDMEDAFSRYMVINFDEMEGLNNRNIELFKNMMTRDTLEVMNRRESVRKKRIACPIFTTNKNQESGGFMTQAWGIRRYGVIEITDIDKSYSEKVDVDQMWSEALLLYESSKFKYLYDDVDYAEFKEYNAKYIFESLAMRFLQLNISKPENENKGEYLSSTEIYQRLSSKMNSEEKSRITIGSLGEAMRAMGFVLMSKRMPGKTVPLKKYHVVIKEIKMI